MSDLYQGDVGKEAKQTTADLPQETFIFGLVTDLSLLMLHK